MRPPRTLIAAFIGLSAFTLMPAFAADPAPGDSVEITVDLDASAEEIYRSIRDQAWAACKPDRGNHSVAARINTRRKCQQAMVADVAEKLSEPDVIELAEKACQTGT